MAVTKSYALGAEQKAKVAEILAKGHEKYASIEHIVCQSVFDAGGFFQDDDDEEDRADNR